MAYVLVVAALLILIHGLGKLSGSRAPHTVPWPSLVTWAVLFGGGLAVWIMTVHGR